MEKTKEIRLKDIADQLDLGVTTVSDILLRGKTNYRGSTIDLVKKTAEELGYRPNTLAQSMRSGRTSTIGILLTYNLIDPFFAELLNGLEEELDRRGLVVILSISDQKIEKDKKALRFFESHRVDGLLVGPVYKQAMTIPIFDQYKTSIPSVMMLADQDAPCDTVDLEHGPDSTIGRIAAEHLMEMGHRNIGYFMCPPDVREDQGSHPYRGFVKSLRERNLFRSEWIWEGHPPVAQNAYQKMKELLSRYPSRDSFPTALYCHNDHCAMGAMAALREHSFRVPEDISIIGTDNIDVSSFTSPRLTTIDLKPSEIAREAVALLMERLDNPKRPLRHSMITPEFISRESVQRVGPSCL
ncbi:MAG: LacI family DNA-binding transcriptional regulator [Verrucomicrobiota bacterium]